jgi:tripartite-type tricarboxylate transporter receptor subunit TctC
MEPTRRNPKSHASNIGAGLFAFALLASAAPALGQESAEAAFYKGKTVTIITSTGAGGGYDFVARLLARSMPKNMPGAPTMIVQNMPGGGNVVATNYMYEVAPKDGTAIAVVNNAVPLNQVMDGRGVRFDSSKFNWIGSTGGRNEAIFILSSAGISSVDDLKTKEAVLGGTAPGSSIVIFPMAMNRVLGTKFRIVTGYKSSAEVFLAMDRGEIVARSGTLPSLQTGFPHWLAENRIRFLAQVGLVRDRELPDVPLLTELAQTDEQRRVLALISSPPALGQPYLAPPGVPRARVDTLRAAFAKTIAEADFIAEAGKAGIDIMPMSGPDVAKIIDEVVNADPEIIRQARAALAN